MRLIRLLLILAIVAGSALFGVAVWQGATDFAHAIYYPALTFAAAGISWTYWAEGKRYVTTIGVPRDGRGRSRRG